MAAALTVGASCTPHSPSSATDGPSTDTMHAPADAAVNAGIYDVFVHDDGGTRRLGQIKVDERSVFTIVQADNQADLARIVKTMNEKDVMHVPTIPPPGSPKFTDASRIVPRADADFFPAASAFLTTYYDVELRRP